MRQILIIFALIASAFYASYGYAQETLPKAEFKEMKRVGQSKVADVVSPLTLLMEDGSIIRLAGIDIPNSYGDDISELAVTARDILKDLLVGKRIEAYQTKNKKVGLVNRMGHDLAHVERHGDKAWAQGTLLALGLARVKTTPENAHMAVEMLALEAAARDEKLGIWAGEAFAIHNAEDAESAIGSFAIVEGRIESVALKKNRIYINFGKDWKSDFTVSIAPMDKRKFSKAKLDPLGWGGKVIRVRGSVREYNGPYMEVMHPEAVEFIKE